jgi:hypothetical protein
MLPADTSLRRKYLESEIFCPLTAGVVEGGGEEKIEKIEGVVTVPARDPWKRNRTNI